MSEITTIQQAEEYAAERGLILTATDRKRIAKVQQAEAQRLSAVSPDGSRRSWADRFNAFYPRLLESLVRIGDTVLTLAQTVLVSFGVPVVLVLLLVVEHHRVYEGILLFDPSPTFASFAAWALVLLNLVLEFQVNYVEHSAGYQEARRARWSLRLVADELTYRLGLGQSWRIREQSPALRYRQLLSLVTFTILALALVGSMRSVIAETDGAWYQAIVTIVTESNLLLLLTWLGGLLFAVAAVLSAQGLSRYVALRCVEIVADMERRNMSQDDQHAAEVERAGALAAVAIITEMERRKAEKNATTPFGSTLATPEGRENSPATQNGNAPIVAG